MKKLLLLVVAFALVFVLSGCFYQEPQEVICTFPEPEVKKQDAVVYEVEVTAEEINEAQGKLYAKETKARLILEDYTEALDNYNKLLTECEIDATSTSCQQSRFYVTIVNDLVEKFNEYMEKNADVWEYVEKPSDIDVVLEIIVIEEE